MSRISLDEIDNLPFWLNYFGCSYLNLYDEEEDASVSELMGELCTQEVLEWWKTFTGWYDGVLDECDGYLDDPAFLEVPLTRGRTLKIEFHPGDTLYYIDGEEIGSCFCCCSPSRRWGVGRPRRPNRKSKLRWRAVSGRICVKASQNV